MKKHVGFLALGLMAVSLSAFGVFDPTWERPILEARLVELVDGHEVGSGLEKKLTLNRRDGQKTATTFTLEEEHQVQCITAPCPPVRRTTQFRTSAPTTGPCNTTVYQAVENTRIRFPRRLTLVDNSTNICDMPIQYVWEATVTESNHQVRHFFGNPEGVVTVQSVLR